MKPHKWAKEIKAWADGAEIEFRWTKKSGGDGTWIEDDNPAWNDDMEFRIKPQPQEPQTYFVYIVNGEVRLHLCSPVGMPTNWVHIGKTQLQIEKD